MTRTTIYFRLSIFLIAGSLVTQSAFSEPMGAVGGNQQLVAQAAATARAKFLQQRMAEARTKLQAEASIAAARARQQRLVRLFAEKIRTKVYNAWKTNFPAALVCTVEVWLSHEGQIMGQPQVLRSSGNPKFDRAVIAAIEKAAPFVPPIGISYSLYKEVEFEFNAEALNHPNPTALQFYKTAEQGNAKAEYALGRAYYKGRNIPRNYAEAVHWWEKAAAQGNVQSECGLGICYYNGFGVPKSYAKAVYWTRKAAKQGYAKAELDLGICYYNGHGVSQSYTYAMYWTRKAAEQGNARAEDNIGYLYYHGKGTSTNHAEAVYWWKKSAVQGDVQSEFYLGISDYYGIGTSQNSVAALYWLKKVAAHGGAFGKKASRMTQHIENG